MPPIPQRPFDSRRRLTWSGAFLALGFFFCGSPVAALAQLDGFDLWQEITEQQAAARVPAALKTTAKREIVPLAYRTLALNKASMAQLLAAAPAESPTRSPDAGSEILLPLPQGGYGRFSALESPIMEPALAAQFPEIKNYILQGVDDPTATGRIDTSPKGFRAMVISASGTFFIDPYWSNNNDASICYSKKDFTNADKLREWTCGVVGDNSPIARAARTLAAQPRPTGATLRVYRAAIAATGEYTAFHGGTVVGALAAINTSLARVNTVYERDFCIRMVLVGNNSSIIYTNAAADPYTNGDPGLMINQNQTNVDAVIGNANYDIGHVFGTDSGGLAGLGVVCLTGQKARGVTGSSAPVNDPFDIDYVAHEMGHQFAGNHTFNASGNSNRNASTAFEPGSGSTVMAYAGIVAGQDLQANSDDHFHTGSYTEIDNYTSSGVGAGAISNIATGNAPPVIGALSDYTIPAQTPFALTASATDANGDTLTYCWEEYDTGAAQNPTVNPRDNGASPIFRSYRPSTNATRLFPSLQYILNNTNVPPATYISRVTNNSIVTTNTNATGEFLPTTSRTMTYRVSVRDNRAGGGGQNWNSLQVTTISNAGPFRISSQNTATTVSPATPFNVTWDVAGTTNAPISAANVKISLSTNGGTNFPVVLAESVPNNGSASVTIPGGTTTTAGRLKVEAVGNIFFDVNDANLTVSSAFVAGQITLADTNSFTENFDSMGASATAALPNGLKMTAAGQGTSAGWDTAANLTNVTQQASTGSPTSGGRYNWGSSATDRSAGFMTSGSYASPNGVMAKVVNNTGSTMTGLNVSFDIERYRINTAAANVTFFTSVDGATWTSVPAGDSGAFATGASSYTFAGGTVVSKNLSLLGLSISNGGAIYLKWNFNTTGGNSQGLGLDNLALQAVVPSANAPVITSASTASAVGFTSFSYQITASQSPTSYNATGLPAGLSVDTATGLISGTPTEQGTFNVTLAASNGSGTGTAPLTLTVTKNPGAPTITSPLSVGSALNAPFSYQVEASNSPTTYSASNLQTGLSIDTTTGLISGTPTAGGVRNVIITASNALGTDTQTLVLFIGTAAVVGAPTTASAYTSAAVSWQVIATGPATGYSATGLPAGFSINTSTGLITGTASATPGTSTFQVTATNPLGSDTKTFTLAVLDQAAQNAIPLNVVVNKYANSTPDQIQLLVVGNGTPGSTVDMRGMIIKDFSSNMASDGGGKYAFADNVLWAAVPSGSFITLSTGATSAEDFDLADFYVAANLDNTTYFTNLGGAGAVLDIGTTEMIMIKAAGTGALGSAGGIHCMGSGTAGAQFNAFLGAKLLGSGTTAAGNAAFANNATPALSDYGASGQPAATGATGATPIASLDFASWNNSSNQAYVISLRGSSTTPAILASPSSLSGLIATQGAPGAGTNFTASASNLSNNITVTANDAVNFAISTNNTDFTNTLTLLTNGTGGVSNTPVYVRLTGASQGAQSNTVSLVSGSTSTNVIVTGTVTNLNAPSLSVSPASLTNFVTTAGTASAAKTFTVTGTNLQGDVIVTPPTGYQVSLDGNSWTSTLTVPRAYSAFDDFYVNVPATGGNGDYSRATWIANAGTVPFDTGLTNANTWGYAGGNFNGVGAPSSVGTYVSGGNFYPLTSGGSLAGPGASYALGGGNFWIGYNDQYAVATPGQTQIGKYTKEWFAGSPNHTGNPDGTNNKFLWLQGTGLQSSTDGLGAILTWTAPNAGTFTFNGSYVNGNYGPSTSFAIVDSLNNTNLAKQTLAPSSSTNSFSFTRTYSAGDVVQFQVGTPAASQGSPLGLSVEVTPAAAISRIVYVRIAPSAPAGPLAGNVSVASASAGTQLVAVSGTVNAAPSSSLTVEGILTNFSTVQGVASAPQSLLVQGSGLTSNVTVSAPANLQFTTNTNDPASYVASLVLPISDGALSNAVFARIPDTAVVGGPTTNAITASSGSTSATTNAVTTVTANTNPSISVNPTNLTGFLTQQGTASTNQTVTVSGTNLQGPLTVTAPADYEVSRTADSGFAASVELTPVAPRGIAVAKADPVVIASDNAGVANYPGGTASWTNGANGGTGFQGWQLAGAAGGVGGFNGNFIGSALTNGVPLVNYASLFTGGVAFSSYAGGNAGAYQDAVRSFAQAMKVGDVLTHSIAICFDNGNKGFTLLDGTSEVFFFNVNSGGYSWSGGGAAAITPWPGVRENGVVINFSITRTVAGFDYAISSPQDPNLTRSGSVAATGITALKYYISGAGGGDPGNLYFNNLQITSAGGGGGNVADTTLYVRLKSDAAAASAVDGTLTVSSQNATSRNVALSGRVAQVTVSTNSLAPFISLNGAASSPQTFTVSGEGLGTTPITITAPTGFEISGNGGTSYASSLTLTPVGGAVSGTTITVRMPAGQTVGATPSGNIAIESLPASSTVAVSGSVLPPGPTILFTPVAGISGLSTTRGTASPPGSVTVNGFSLTGSITANAPSGFEVAAAGGTFGPTATLPPSGGALEVRIAASAVEGPVSGNVALASGSTSASIPVSGTVAPTPVISVWPSTLEPFDTVVGNLPPRQNLNFSGSNLVGSITVAVPSGFEIFVNGVSVGASFVAPGPGSYQLGIAFTNVSSTGTTTGNITLTTQGGVPVSIPVTATVLPMPSISVTPASLGGFETYEGYSSDDQTFQVSGSNLLWDLELWAPDGFEISLDGVVWQDWLALEPVYSGGQPAPPVFVEGDDASNYSSFQNGSDGGKGFDPWVVASNNNDTTIFAGSFLGDSTAGAGNINTGGASFGLYANPGAASINADRNLQLGLRTGEVLRFQLALNLDNGNKGFRLYSGGAGGTELMGFNVGTGATVTAGAGLTLAPGSGKVYDYGGPAALQVTITRLSDTTLSYEISRTSPQGNQGVLFSGTISSASPLGDPDGLRFYNTGTSDGAAENNLYFNNLQIGIPGRGTGGVVDATTVYVRVKDNAPVGALAGNLDAYTEVVVASEFVSTVVEQVALSGDVYPVPQLSVDPAMLTGFETPRGIASATQVFDLNGTDIRDPIDLLAPPGFELSENPAGPFDTTMTITPSSPGAAVQAQIFVRIAADAPAGIVDGVIDITSGLASASVAVDGLVVVPQGQPVDNFSPPSANAQVEVVAPASGGAFYIGGQFTNLVRSGVTNSAVRVARILADGTVDTGFNVGTGPNGTVRALLPAPSGASLYVGGTFTNVSGQPRTGLARLSTASGALDTAFNAVLGGVSSPIVNAIVWQGGGKILVGGIFTTAGSGTNSASSANLARFNADGTRDTSFVPPAPNGEVKSIALQPDGKILIAGAFAQVAGQPRKGLARLNADGTLDNTFTVGTGSTGGFNGTVWSVAVAPDASIYAGGQFSSYNGRSVYNNLAKLSSTGVLQTRFNYAGALTGGINNVVRSVMIRPDGDILVAGQFTQISNSLLFPTPQATGRVAQFVPNGTLSSAFNPGGLGANNSVLGAATLSNGNLVLVGAFTQFNGQPFSRIVVLTGGQPSKPEMSYAAWLSLWFTPDEIADPSVSGPDVVNGNPSGLSNFAIYALSGDDPHVVSTIAPVSSIVEVGGVMRLSHTAPKNPLAMADVAVEYSSDLKAAWQPCALTEETDTQITGYANDPVNAAPHQFLRLKITPWPVTP